MKLWFQLVKFVFEKSIILQPVLQCKSSRSVSRICSSSVDYQLCRYPATAPWFASSVLTNKANIYPDANTTSRWDEWILLMTFPRLNTPVVCIAATEWAGKKAVWNISRFPCSPDLARTDVQILGLIAMNANLIANTVDEVTLRWTMLR